MCFFLFSFKMSKRVRPAKQTEQSPPCKRLKEAAPLSTVADLVKHTTNFNEILKLNYDCFLNVFSYLSKEDLLAVGIVCCSFKFPRSSGGFESVR